MEDIFTYYRVRLEFITKLCASVPADPNLIAKWLESRQPRVKPPGGRSIDEINEEVLASLPEEEEPVQGLIFQRDNSNGANLVLRTATFRAHIKDCAEIISSFYIGRIQGERSFAVKVKHCVYHDEKCYWTPILRPDGSKLIEADGKLERPVHSFVKGRPVNSLKMFEFVESAVAEFTLKILGDIVKEKDLETLFLYGGTHGYGGERSNGEGRYTFSIQQINKAEEVKEHGREKAGRHPAANDRRSEQRS